MEAVEKVFLHYVLYVLSCVSDVPYHLHGIAIFSCFFAIAMWMWYIIIWYLCADWEGWLCCSVNDKRSYCITLIDCCWVYHCSHFIHGMSWSLQENENSSLDCKCSIDWIYFLIIFWSSKEDPIFHSCDIVISFMEPMSWRSYQSSLIVLVPASKTRNFKMCLQKCIILFRFWELNIVKMSDIF